MEQNIEGKFEGQVTNGLGLVGSLVSAIVQGDRAGIPVNDVVKKFAETNAEAIVGGLLVGGTAIGGLVSQSIWKNNLEWFDKLRYKTGFNPMPKTVPMIGLAVGAGIMGTAVYSLFNVFQGHKKNDLAKVIYGMSYAILGRQYAVEEEKKIIHNCLLEVGLSEKEISKASNATEQEAVRIAKSNFQEDKLLQILQILFPLVYVNDGEYTIDEKVRFEQLAVNVGLTVEQCQEVVENVEEYWDSTWITYSQMVNTTGLIAANIDHDEKFEEKLMSEIEDLLSFDPRHSANERKATTISVAKKALQTAAMLAILPAEGASEAVLLGSYVLLKGSAKNEKEAQEISRSFTSTISDIKSLKDGVKKDVKKSKEATDNIKNIS